MSLLYDRASLTTHTHTPTPTSTPSHETLTRILLALSVQQSRVGQNRMNTYTVYDRMLGDFPAQNTVYTPYMYGSSHSYNRALHDRDAFLRIVSSSVTHATLSQKTELHELTFTGPFQDFLFACHTLTDA